MNNMTLREIAVQFRIDIEDELYSVLCFRDWFIGMASRGINRRTRMGCCKSGDPPRRPTDEKENVISLMESRIRKSAASRRSFASLSFGLRTPAFQFKTTFKRDEEEGSFDRYRAGQMAPVNWNCYR